jgi:hypothetical protein
MREVLPPSAFVQPSDLLILSLSKHARPWCKSDLFQNTMRLVAFAPSGTPCDVPDMEEEVALTIFL